MTFYDSTGRAVAYTDDNENIYLFSGVPVAYLFGSLVYSYKGQQLGRFENGWVRDIRGLCVFFTENTNGLGPIKPIKRVKPIKMIKKLCPIKRIRQIPKIKAIEKISWSNLSGEQFFFL